MSTAPIEVEAVAFEGPNTPDRGYTIKAIYLKPPHSGDALVEINKDGEKVREFLFPAYKIYNLQAHFSEIVDSEIAGGRSSSRSNASTCSAESGSHLLALGM